MKKLKSLLQVIENLSTDKPDEKVLESLHQMIGLPAFKAIESQIKAKIEELTPAVLARKKLDTLKSVVENQLEAGPTQTMQPCDSLDCEHVPPEMTAPDYSKPWPEIEEHIRREWKRFTDFYDNENMEFPVQLP
jgi:hypothetical protein